MKKFIILLLAVVSFSQTNLSFGQTATPQMNPESEKQITFEVQALEEIVTKDEILNALLPFFRLSNTHQNPAPKAEQDTLARDYLRRMGDRYVSNFTNTMANGDVDDSETNEPYSAAKNKLFTPEELEFWGSRFSKSLKADESSMQTACEQITEQQVLIFDQTSKLSGYMNSISEFGWQIMTEKDYAALRKGLYLKKALVDYAALRLNESCSASRPPEIAGQGHLPGPGFIDEETQGIKYLTEQFLPSVINFQLIGALAFGVIALVVAGIMFIVSDINPEAKETAKKSILWIIIGIILALSSYAIVRLVVGINIIGF